jgi:hypothetical protein
MMSSSSLQPQDDNWRLRAMLAGGIVGSLIGVAAAYFYVRAAEESAGDDGPRPVPTREAVRLATQLFAILRQIAELGGRQP